MSKIRMLAQIVRDFRAIQGILSQDHVLPFLTVWLPSRNVPEMLGALLNEPSPEPIDYPDIVPDVAEHILDIIPKKRIYAAV